MWAKVVLGLFLFFLLKPTPIRATEKTIIVLNQVRGPECCEAGSTETVKRQIEVLSKLNLPAAFALRYDALTPAYAQLFAPHPELEIGLFLEITPQLASDANVPYRGPVERWYKAENAYLLGYTNAARLRLIDTAMQRFHTTFGFFPKTTVAWMIDNVSLKYLVDTYGVTTHEITRDQWGTDSYTLYGGPIGPTYLPSINWPLIPAASRTGALPVVMLRQTIADPVWNYGDSESIFTSQPNDYLKAKKNTRYFEQLLNQSLSQQPEGLAVVGLESSMLRAAQQEFEEQLELVDAVREKEASIQIVTPKDYAQARLAKDNQVSTNVGKSDLLTAVWVNAPTYRLRFLFDAFSHTAILDDVRIYSDRFVDPYATGTTQTPNAYWVVPYILDGSRFYYPEKLSWLQKILKVGKAKLHLFDPCFVATQVRYDACSRPEGINLPDLGTKDSLKVKGESLSYLTPKGEAVVLKFLTDAFWIKVPSANRLSFIPSSPLLKELNQSSLFNLVHKREGDTYTFAPWVNQNTSLSQIYARFPDLFLPETAGDIASLSTSLLVEAKSIVGLNRNPIRVVVYLRDERGRVASAAQDLSLSFAQYPKVKTKTEHPETSLGEYYLDGFPDSVGWYTPTVTLGKESKTLPPILVVPNCLSSLDCLKHPFYLWKWIEMLVRDRLQH